MRTRILGGLTGLLVGATFLFIAPSAAQAASWSSYANGYYPTNAVKSSAKAKVLRNRVNITPPVALVFNQKLTVVVPVTKGAILASATTDAGIVATQYVPSPQSNTVARCQLVGPGGLPNGLFDCEVYK